MIDELGQFALCLALALSLAQAALSVVGRLRRDVAVTGAGEGAAVGAFGAILVAFLALIHAFVASDFSVLNVAANSHTAKPLIYKIAGAWGSHEGSILLWCLMLTAYGAALALTRGLPFGLKAWAVAVQGGLGVLFIGYMVLASNPLARLAMAPVQGQSLNPLLQDPALAAHPPFLYAGYVGFSVVFSLSAAALAEGRVDPAWGRWIRPWSLAAWSLLTVGITLGSFWAYYELGWGGWWAWDPVENASFMPWLMGAALIHSATVTEKRAAMASWTAFLGLAAFTLAMMGAFLVRSGVLTSVHAFAIDPQRGVLLLAILGIAAGAGFALFAWRAPTLRDEAVFAPISREGALFLNNILLAAATATVLIGTLLPLIREAIDGTPISVGAPYFNLTFGALLTPALLLAPVGPFLAWKRGDLRGAVQRLWAAAFVALAAAFLAWALKSPRDALAAAGIGLGAWVVAGALAEAAERVRLGRARVSESARRAMNLPLGAWGMTLAHIGVGLFAMGAATETAWRAEAAQPLSPGQTMRLAGFELRLDRAEEVSGPNYEAQRVVLRVTEASGRFVCEAEPERRVYAAQGQTTSQVAICPGLLDDVYVVTGDARAAADGTDAFLIRAYWNPWVRLVFFGPLFMALGGALSLSDRRLRFAAPARARAAPSPALAE